jgi:glycosyltransferase involved in cell wall biosynthesis
MKFSIITPCYQAERYIRDCVDSVVAQRADGIELEYRVLDGGSTDKTLAILNGYGDQIDSVISEADQGPADAINKGFTLATGDIVAWLNADDVYTPGILKRVEEAFLANPQASFVFGHCPIVDEQDMEIRKFITRFKECFFPFSSRFVFQCINYISQPACFFRRSAVEAAGPLRLDIQAAWDYDFLLRMWRQGKGVRIPNPPLAQFRWHEGSISGQHFRTQFEEEFQLAKTDAGTVSLQTLLHWGVKCGIIGAYSMMERRRKA